MKILKRLVIATSLVCSLLLPVLSVAPAQATGLTSDTTAGQLTNNLDAAGQKGFNQSSQNGTVPSLSGLIGTYVGIILGFTGTLAFLAFLYGGFLWLSAGGNDEQVGKSKKILFNATVGIVVVVLAYSISYYITNVLYTATK